MESLSKSGKEQEEEDLKEMVREVNRKRKRTYEIEGKDPRKQRFRERSRTRIERSGGDNKNEIKEQQTKTGIFMSTEEKNKVETLAGQPKLGSPEGKDALV